MLADLILHLDGWNSHDQRHVHCSPLGDPIIGANSDGREGNVLHGIDNILQGSDQRTIANIIELIHDDPTEESGVQDVNDEPEGSAIDIGKWQDWMDPS